MFAITMPCDPPLQDLGSTVILVTVVGASHDDV
jgi:hypothetical protein